MDKADRERTIQAVRLFAERTQDCIGRKLFKLLYIADAQHFQQTGQPITGLEFVSRNSMPLPHELKYELEAPKEDLLELVEITTFLEDGSQRHRFNKNPQTAFDSGPFTRRQLAILTALADQFAGSDAADIHPEAFDNGAWKNTPLNRLINLVDSVPRDRADYADLMSAAEQYQSRRAAQHYFR
jgi:hypothetical protein